MSHTGRADRSVVTPVHPWPGRTSGRCSRTPFRRGSWECFPRYHAFYLTNGQYRHVRYAATSLWSPAVGPRTSIRQSSSTSGCPRKLSHSALLLFLLLSCSEPEARACSVETVLLALLTSQFDADNLNNPDCSVHVGGPKGCFSLTAAAGRGWHHHHSAVNVWRDTSVHDLCGKMHSPPLSFKEKFVLGIPSDTTTTAAGG